jgi:hypothetical protein
MVGILDVGASRPGRATLIHYRCLLEAVIDRFPPANDVGRCAAEGISEVVTCLLGLEYKSEESSVDGDREEHLCPYMCISTQSLMLHSFSSGLVYALMKYVSECGHRSNGHEWESDLMDAAVNFFRALCSNEQREESETRSLFRHEFKACTAAPAHIETFVEARRQYNIHIAGCHLSVPKPGRLLQRAHEDRIRTGLRGFMPWVLNAERAGRLHGLFLLFLLRLHVKRHGGLRQTELADRDVHIEIFFLLHDVIIKGGPLCFIRCLEREAGVMDFVTGLQAMRVRLSSCLDGVFYRCLD